MKTIEEINDHVENTEMVSTPETILRLANAIVWLAEVVQSQESKLRQIRNVASWLVNGIERD